MPWVHVGTTEALSVTARADVPTPPPTVSESMVVFQGLILLGTGLCFQLIGIWRTLQEERWEEEERRRRKAAAERRKLEALEAGADGDEGQSRVAGTQVQQGDDEDDLGGWEILLFPLVASCGLLLMYFFGNILFWILVGGMCLLTLVSVPYVLEPLMCLWCLRPAGCKGSYRSVTRWDVVGTLLGAVIAAGWVWTKEWWLHDIVNVCAGVTALCSIRVKEFKWSSLLLAGLFCYDFFWVYLSTDVFGSNVMLSVATISRTVARHPAPPEPGPALHLPGTLIFPNPNSGLGYSLLGLGDLVLPGLWVQQCFRYDIQIQKAADRDSEGESLLGGARRSRCFVYTSLSLALYVLGLLLCDIALDVTQRGQPALVFIVPSLLIGTLTTAKCRGDFDEMW
eukprot:Hpha_TRINITY_DN139_c0_g1::TRINITY_DN139_c0_g1_i1::g.82243::m.82243/K09598/SPPL3; signal peptide peptidase-like 3